METANIIPQFSVEVVDQHLKAAVSCELSRLGDHLDRRLGTLFYARDILRVGIDNKVLCIDPGHQHVGLDPGIRHGLTRQRAIVLEIAFGPHEVGHADQRDDR